MDTLLGTPEHADTGEVLASRFKSKRGEKSCISETHMLYARVSSSRIS